MKTHCKDCQEAKKTKVKPYALCDFHRKKYHYDWRRKNKEDVLRTRRTYYQKCKKEVLEYYSKGSLRCACCSEATYEFLTIDHINGSGRKHKKEIRNRLHAWLRLNNYPEGYQILCFNCNCGQSINKGICPHKNYLPK